MPATDRRRFLLGLGLLAAAAVAPAQVGMTAVAGAPPAPPLRLADGDDRPVDLAGQRGRVVLVNFWATWCPPCRREFPSLGRLRRLFRPEELQILAVNVGEDPDVVFAFAGSTSFPVLYDRDSSAMAAWRVRGLPTTFLVDRGGRLAYRATGGREFDDPGIVATIRQLLEAAG